MYSKQTLLCSLVICSLIVLTGCEKPAGPNMDISSFNDTNIKRLRNAYDMYKLNHSSVGPADEATFKEYLTTNPGAIARLKRMGIDSTKIDDIFVSERDGQPFKVRWGLKGPADHAVVFESEGVDGKRLVAFAKPRELGGEEYDGYWTGKIKPESPDEFDTANPEEGAKENYEGEGE